MHISKTVYKRNSFLLHGVSKLVPRHLVLFCTLTLFINHKTFLQISLNRDCKLKARQYLKTIRAKRNLTICNPPCLGVTLEISLT